MRLVNDPLVRPYFNTDLEQEFKDLCVRVEQIVEELQNKKPITTKELLELLHKQTRRPMRMIFDAIAYCLKKNTIQFLIDTSDWRRYQRLSLRR